MFTDPLPYLAKLGNRYVKLFEHAQATRADKMLMVNKMLLPLAWNPESYIALDTIANRRDRDCVTSLKVALGEIAYNSVAYFTNAMAQHNPAYPRTPSERSVLGKYVAFTFEFDKMDIGFLKKQLDWCLPLAHPDRSVMGKLSKDLSQFSDFKGLTVVYGGNKSLHIHLIFSGADYIAAHGHPKIPYHGFSALWETLQGIVEEHVKPPTEMTADRMVKTAIGYKRAPWGTRHLNTPNLLGMPEGSVVEQVVLWEQWRERAGRNAYRALLIPSVFAKSERNAAIKRTDAQRSNGNIGRTLTASELAHCETLLRANYQDIKAYPRFDRLRFDGQWKAYFYNSARDNSANSIMREDYNTILAVGTDCRLVSVRDKTIQLPFKLGLMLNLWCKQLADRVAMIMPTSIVIADEGDAYFVEVQRRRVDEEFSERCKVITELCELRQLACEAALRLLETESISALRATEGAGKTTALLKSFPDIASGRSGLAMFAFGDYQNAQEKCDAFNGYKHSGHYGIVWKSWSRSYEEICNELGVKEFCLLDAARAGMQSVWELVKARQHVVIDALKKRSQALWKAIGERKPVIFTVHDVAQNWTASTNTRLMLNVDFWATMQPQGDAKRAMLDATKLHTLVHDEIAVSTFVEPMTRAQQAWILKHRDKFREFLRKGRSADALKWFGTNNDYPGGLDYQSVAKLIGINGWRRVTTRDSGEFMIAQNSDPTRDIYASTHGNEWYIGNRLWWKDTAERIIFLTTEAAPLAVAKEAVSELLIVNLEPENVAMDYVDVVLMRVTAANTQNTVDALKVDLSSAFDDLQIITNSAQGHDIISHFSARGRNDFAHKDILQVVHFPHPEVYERLQALNAYTGRTDLVMRTITDAINQTCGRNRGFRNTGTGTEHMAIMPHRLYSLMVNSNAVAFLRYHLTPKTDSETRREKRR